MGGRSRSGTRLPRGDPSRREPEGAASCSDKQRGRKRCCSTRAGRGTTSARPASRLLSSLAPVHIHKEAQFEDQPSNVVARDVHEKTRQQNHVGGEVTSYLIRFVRRFSGRHSDSCRALPSVPPASSTHLWVPRRGACHAPLLPQLPVRFQQTDKKDLYHISRRSIF